MDSKYRLFRKGQTVVDLARPPPSHSPISLIPTNNKHRASPQGAGLK